MRRRQFLGMGVAAAPLLFGTGPLTWAQTPERKYDVLLKGGRIIDPSQSMNAVADLAIAGGKVATIAPDIDAREATRTVRVTGQIVTPGLIDLHVHGFSGLSRWGLDLDPYCIARGVTTAVDAGTAGADAFEGFRRLVIERSRTRVLAFLNIARVGLTAEPGELIDLRMIDAPAALRVAKEHADVIVGLKVRCGRNYSGPNDLHAVKAARTVCDAIGKPLMIHVNTPYTPMDQILKEARPGDIVTHAFRRSGTSGVIGPEGRVSDYNKEARARGILFDIGHGSGGFSFAATAAALKENFPPSTISSDIHAPSALGPVFDLPTTMAKMMVLGMPLEKVVELVTTAPARAIHKTPEMGSLKPGSSADVAVFELVQGDFSLVDSQGDVRKATQKLAPVLALRGGKIP
jgi:dihydroorotase